MTDIDPQQDIPPKLVKQLFTEFNEEFLHLWHNRGNSIGRIVKSHLLLEHYLNEYLRVIHPSIRNIDALKLSFKQKLSMLDLPGDMMTYILPVLDVINRLRNRLVHSLDIEMNDDEIDPIRKLLAFTRKQSNNDPDLADRSPADLIEESTKLLCSLFDTLTRTKRFELLDSDEITGQSTQQD
ncbi:hypothetical protein AB833_26135 [Chromatiales bacterium (ex Bugula neritina AB1)]|nr:hypothetical protein AB833_26135 [Chromatiales bacterium (ex Bugula neritina AB1)]